MRILAVIPARFASTRLPGKPLCDICGKPMIQHVYEHVRAAANVDDVLVATDDPRIADAVRHFGGAVEMTSPHCPSGSDRLLEVARKHKADIYLNIQGDEPLLPPASIDVLVAGLLNAPEVDVATLCFAISAAQATSPDLVKVTRDAQGNALYFSRSVIPYARDDEHPAYIGHCGVYAYRSAALHRFGELAPSPLELAEKLEQLRLLQAGMSIRVLNVDYAGPAVDTANDLDNVRRIMGGAEGIGSMGHMSNAPISSPPTHDDILRKIRLVITDVDGVLTDGGLYYGAEGEALKRFHARDGLGIRMLQKAGIRVAVLSGRDCPALRARLHDLDIDLFQLGELQKNRACADIIKTAGLTPEQTLFVGDDVPDMQAFACCGLSVAVADAPEYVRSAAQITLQTRGGEGALRELADALLNAQGYSAFFAQQNENTLFCKEDSTC